jgi:hypothetical protein
MAALAGTGKPEPAVPEVPDSRVPQDLLAVVASTLVVAVVAAAQVVEAAVTLPGVPARVARPACPERKEEVEVEVSTAMVPARQPSPT